MSDVAEIFYKVAKAPVPWNPHPYQKKAAKFLVEHACGALFLDPGLGKTSVTLGAIKFLKGKGLVSKVLLIAPLRPCYTVWPKEIQKWADFNKLKCVILHGPKKEQALKEDADIYLINPEGLPWLLKAEKTTGTNGRVAMSVDTKRFKALGFDTLVIDELSKFKNQATGRFKAMKNVIGLFGRRWGLTGSPASNGLEGLFGQCFMLDQGRSLGPYISHYRLKYFIPHHSGFGWKVRPGAEEQIYERIAPLALRMAGEDYLDLPELIVNNIRVDLPPEAMKLYLQMEADLLTSIEDKVISAATAGVASGKCRQLANGGIYLDPEVQTLVKQAGPRETRVVHSAKTEALADLVDELQGSPLLVAYDFHHDLERLRAKFPDAVFVADYSMKEFPALEASWNRGEISLMFGHAQSMAHGLNLQEAGNHVAWYALTWNFEDYDQFIRRVLRQGNTKKKVFVHHFIARNTIDEVMLMSLNRKDKTQKALFTGLQELAKLRKRRKVS